MAKTKLSVEQEILDAVEAQRGKKETDDQSYLERLTRLCDKKLDEANWESLSEVAQDWVEKAMKALTNQRKIPAFPKAAGASEVEEDDAAPLDDDADGTDVEASVEDASESEEEEEEVKPKKAGKKSAAVEDDEEGVVEDDGEEEPNDDDESEEDMEAQEEAVSKKKSTKKVAAKPEKKAVAKAEKKPEKKAAPKANGEKKAKASRGGGFDPKAKIKLLVKENPKREGSITHKKFAKIKSGMTVEEAFKAGLTGVDLKCDVDRKYISIG